MVDFLQNPLLELDPEQMVEDQYMLVIFYEFLLSSYMQFKTETCNAFAHLHLRIHHGHAVRIYSCICISAEFFNTRAVEGSCKTDLSGKNCIQTRFKDIGYMEST